MKLDESITVASLMGGIPTTAFEGEKRVIVGHPEDTLADAQTLFNTYDLHHLPIVTDGYHLVGMVSVRDIMRVYSESAGGDRAELQAIKLGTIMTPNPKTIRPQTPVREAISILANAPFQALPVVDPTGHVKGIVTTRDLVKLLNDRLQRQ